MHASADEKNYAIDLSWKIVEGASGYIIYINDGSGYRELTKITDPKTVTYRFTGAEAKKSYKFKIETLGSDGKVMETTEKTMKLPALPTSGPELLIPVALAGASLFIRRKRKQA